MSFSRMGECSHVATKRTPSQGNVIAESIRLVWISKDMRLNFSVALNYRPLPPPLTHTDTVMRG